MADTPRKTYPELETETTVEDSDLLASFRGDGPLKKLAASVVLDYIDAGIQPSVTAAQTAASDSQAAAAVSAGYAGAGEVSMNLAAQYAGDAQVASLASRYYPNARDYVPRGIIQANFVAGSGYTDGVYDITTTGGSLTVQGTVRVTVAAGAITAAVVTGPGLYVGPTPVAPTVPLGALGAGVGGSVTAALGFLVGSGEFYWTDDAVNANLADLYFNNAGTAAPTSPLVTLAKSLTAGVVPCTVAAPSGISYPMTPVAGFSVVAAGVNQEFNGIAGATNSAGTVTATIAGVFGGVATEIVLPSGDKLPAGTIRLNYPFSIRPSTALGKYVLLYPAFQQQLSYIQLIWMSGTGNALVGRIASPAIKIPADFTNVRFVIQAQGDKPFGSPSLTIYANDGTTLLLATTAIFDKNDSAALTAAGLWANKDWIQVIRNASGRFNIVQLPNTVLTSATEQDAALALQDKTVTDPVFAQKLTDRTWLVELGAVQYDDPSPATGNKMNQDTHSCIIYDMGRAMSQGVLQCSYAPAINSHFASIGGKDFNYSLLYSDEGGGGAFLGDQPSTCEFAIKIGLFSDPTNLYELYGLGHGLLETVSSTLTIDGAPTDYKAFPPTTRLRGSTYVWDTLYNLYRPPTLTPTRQGQVRIIQTLDDSGVTALHTHKVGRSLGYTSGSTQPAEGATLTGQTSGATAIVVVVPAPTSGSFGAGTAAGSLYVKTVSGTFQNGENLRVGGVTYAVATGPAGPQIGAADSYAAMAPTTTINRMKVPGSPEIVIGYEDDVQQPVSLPGQTWIGTNLMQVRHTNDPDIIFQMELLGNPPFDPPGNYSLCMTSQMFAQDRAEGNRKMYANWVSGVKTLYEGTYVGHQRYSFKRGALTP